MFKARQVITFKFQIFIFTSGNGGVVRISSPNYIYVQSYRSYPQSYPAPVNFSLL